MSNRARALVAAVALSALALTACGSRVNSDEPSTGDGGATQAAANTASDVGVTATDIKVGVISGQTSQLFDPDTFSASLYGAKAYFDALNDAGGVNGRKVTLEPCDDKADANANVECVHKLIDDEKVFAFAGTTAYDYAGAPYADSKGVPDVGGQPISDAYYQYSHMYSIYGGFGYPRDGKASGYNGKLYSSTENYQWFKEKLGVKTAGVVFLGVQQSQQYAQAIVKGLQNAGYKVVPEQIDLSLGNYDAAVIDMKSKGVDIVFDAMNDFFNGELCKSMQSQNMQIKAKVTTSQSWSDSAAEVYKDAPVCLNNLYGWSFTKNYNEIDDPLVKKFQDDVAKYTPDRADKINMWMFEGYIAAKWLTDAMASCGADLTRTCVDNYMQTTTYDADGLLLPRDFKVVETPPATENRCVSIAKWTSKAPTGKPGWTAQGDMTKNCFDVKLFSYDA